MLFKNNKSILAQSVFSPFIRLIMLLLWGNACFAATVSEAKDKTTQLPSRKLELARFVPYTGPVTLKNVQDAYDMNIPISERDTVKEAFLHLDFINSNRLIENRSQISVHLNGIAVSQIALNPKTTHTIADIKLPVVLLREGYNLLQFRAAQHYTAKECEAFEAPELWTELNTTESYLFLKTQPSGRRFTLADLDMLINDKLLDYSLKILLPQEKVSEEALQWGGLITQGVAQRLNFVPLHLSLGQAVVNTGQVKSATEKNSQEKHAALSLPFLDQTALNSDAVLVGTRADIGRFLGEQITGRINGPFLGLYPLDTGKGNYLIVISGMTTADVTQAARAFAVVDFPFSDSQDIIVKKMELPKIGLYQLPGVLQPGLSYDFSGLGYTTDTLSGMGGDVSRLTFKLPPDLYTTEDTMVTLRLHLAYGAAFRKDSVLNIFLNGYFEQAIALEGEQGARYRDYQINIPLRSFLPGENTVEFRTVMPPAVTGECLFVQDKNLLVTLFDDSSIEIPAVSHYVKLPDLSLLARAGFPYTGMPYGAGMGIQVRDASNGSILSAWTLLGKLAQVAQFPLVDATLSFQSLDGNLDQIQIGRKDSFDADYFKKSLVKLNQTADYPDALQRTTDYKPLPWWKLWANRILGDTVFQRDRVTTQNNAQVEVTGGLARQTAMMGYQSPFNPDKQMLLITSQDSSRMQSAVTGLIGPELWGQLKGNLIIWDEESKTLAWQDTGEEFSVGKIDENLKYAHYFSMHPWRWIATILVLLLIMAWVVHLLLGLFRRRKHTHVREIDS